QRLDTSHLAFSDLLQLVIFYNLSRDVLPLCLLVPSWVCGLTEQPELLVSHLGPTQRLDTSHLAFSDLLQLVIFYNLSRDVLPLCLLVPSWVCGLTEQPELLVSHLGPS
ncbi:ras and Rab interactor 3 isoform X1, partial [Tachysurus ichikawai]